MGMYICVQISYGQGTRFRDYTNNVLVVPGGVSWAPSDDYLQRLARVYYFYYTGMRSQLLARKNANNRPNRRDYGQTEITLYKLFCYSSESDVTLERIKIHTSEVRVERRD